MPTNIIIVRINAPMQRENSLSNAARNRTPIGPSTLPAEIWRNGAKSVFSSNGIENVSLIFVNDNLVLSTWPFQPFPYHHEKNDARSIRLLYHVRVLYNK